jgi:taurine transport system permease protein
MLNKGWGALERPMHDELSAYGSQPPREPAEKKRFRPTSEQWISGASVAFVFAVWYLITRFDLVSHVFVPSPAETWSAFVEILSDGYKGSSLLSHIGASMERLLLAFFVALVTAVPLGLFSGQSPKVRAAVDPLIEFYRPLPPLAYYTLLVLWFGIGDESKVILLFLAAFAPLYISAVSGAKAITEDHLTAARSLGADRLQVFMHVVFPSSLPFIFTGMRTALGVSFTTLVAAELVAAVSGIGWMVLDASKFLRSDVIFVGIAIMGVIAVLLDMIIRYMQARWAHWEGKG